MKIGTDSCGQSPTVARLHCTIELRLVSPLVSFQYTHSCMHLPYQGYGNKTISAQISKGLCFVPRTLANQNSLVPKFAKLFFSMCQL